jgi:hypothetical protein
VQPPILSILFPPPPGGGVTATGLN